MVELGRCLRAAHEVEDQDDEQDDHENSDDSVARTGNGEHVPSFVDFE